MTLSSCRSLRISRLYTIPVRYQCSRKASWAARRHQARDPRTGGAPGPGCSARPGPGPGRGPGPGQVQGIRHQQQGPPARPAQVGPDVEEVLQGVLAAILQEQGLHRDTSIHQPVPAGLRLAAPGVPGGAAGHEDAGRQSAAPQRLGLGQAGLEDRREPVLLQPPAEHEDGVRGDRLIAVDPAEDLPEAEHPGQPGEAQDRHDRQPQCDRPARSELLQEAGAGRGVVGGVHPHQIRASGACRETVPWPHRRRSGSPRCGTHAPRCLSPGTPLRCPAS